MHSTSLLLALLPLLAYLQAQAQDEGKGENKTAEGGPDLSNFPEWITNDYECVIKCLSGFNDTLTTIPQPDMEGAARTCAATNCAGDGTGNYYQTLYYIQLFYATGSIYEWAEAAPDGYKHATFQFGDEVAASASGVQATASDPWSADVAEKTGGASDGGSSGVSTAPGITGTSTGGDSASHTPSPAKSAGGSGSATSSAARPSGSSNGTSDGNETSGALPVYVTGLSSMGLQTLVGLVVGVVSLSAGGLVTGL